MKVYFLALFSLLFSFHVKSQKNDLPVDFTYIINKCLDSISKSPFEKKQKLQNFSIPSDSLSFDVEFVKNKFVTIISDDFVWLNIHKEGIMYSIQTDNGGFKIYYKMNRKNQITSINYELDSKTVYKSEFNRLKNKWEIVEKMNEDMIQKIVKSIYDIHFKVFI